MTLQDLITAVEGADERLDNETLGRVICAVEGVAFGGVWTGMGDDGSDELCVRSSPDEWLIWSRYRRLAPDMSIDAAVALIERKLPGWHRQYGTEPGGKRASAWLTKDDGTDTSAECFAATEPLALCAALLRAIQSQALENRKDVS